MQVQDEPFLQPQGPEPHPYRTILIAVILVLFVLTMLAQFKSTFKSYESRIVGAPVLSPEEQQKNQIDALKKSDTDGDGLSDYDEINVYHTSPYIKDTDSDGIPDGEEIKRGTDPLCAEGKVCGVSNIAPPDTTTSTQSAPAPAAAVPVDASAAAQAAAGQQFTAAQVRDALIANGVPKEKLDALTDDQLLQMLQQAQVDLNTSTTTLK